MMTACSKPAWRLAAVAAWMLLAGCSAPPATRWHSLLNGTAPSLPAARAALLIDLAPVTVPAAVDQPQWLVRTNDDSLRLLEQERWASSPRDELRAALAERLAQGFGAVDVRTQAPAAAPAPVWRVRVEVQRFESIPGREAWLASAWSVAAPGASARQGSTLSCQSSLHEAAPGDLAALAQAHRRAVLRLADQIGVRLSALSRGQGAACGAPEAP